jgi:hypothetical protein
MLRAEVRRLRRAASITSGSRDPPGSSVPRIPSSSNPRIPFTPRAPRVPSTPRVSCVPSTPAAPGSPSVLETPGIAVLIPGSPSASAIPGIPLALPVSRVSSAVRGSLVSSAPHAWSASRVSSAPWGSLVSGGRGRRGGSTSSRSGQGTGFWVIGGASNLATRSRHAASSSRSLLSVLSQSGTSPPLCE